MAEHLTNEGISSIVSRIFKKRYYNIIFILFIYILDYIIIFIFIFIIIP